MLSYNILTSSNIISHTLTTSTLPLNGDFNYQTTVAPIIQMHRSTRQRKLSLLYILIYGRKWCDLLHLFKTFSNSFCWGISDLYWVKHHKTSNRHCHTPSVHTACPNYYIFVRTTVTICLRLSLHRQDRIDAQFHLTSLFSNKINMILHHASTS